MKLAFLILTHKEPDELFDKLLKYLDSFPSKVIVVHHDYSQSKFNEKLVNKYDLQMVTPFFETKWGDVSKIDAIAAAYRKLFDVAPDFDWLITLSANCFPVKPHNQIEYFFKQSKHDYYMETHELGPQFSGIYKWHYRTLFTKYLFSIPFISRKLKFYKRAIRIPIKPSKTPFKDLVPFTGSDWYFLNNKGARFVLNLDLPNHPLTQFLGRQNMAPDMNASPVEIIIQTLVKNNHELKGCNNNYRYIDWTNSQNWHPNTLTTKHLSNLNISEALFARKFDNQKSNDLINNLLNTWQLDQ